MVGGAGFPILGKVRMFRPGDGGSFGVGGINCTAAVVFVFCFLCASALRMVRAFLLRFFFFFFGRPMNSVPFCPCLNYCKPMFLGPQ